MIKKKSSRNQAKKRRLRPSKPKTTLRKRTSKKHKASPVKTRSLVKKTPQKKALSKKVALGQKVPPFELPSTGDKTFRLEDWKGKNVVFYFYPKDHTPGCTLEGKDFTKLQKKFLKLNTWVFGISRDSIKSHESFKKKQAYRLDLLSDQEEEACHLFDVLKTKNMYGKKVIGIERSTFVVDEKGVLVKQYRGVKVPSHAETVLEFVKTLKQ